MPTRTGSALIYIPERFTDVNRLGFVYSRLVLAKIAESSFRLKTCRRILDDMVLHIDFGFVSGGKVIGAGTRLDEHAHIGRDKEEGSVLSQVLGVHKIALVYL